MRAALLTLRRRARKSSRVASLGLVLVAARTTVLAVVAGDLDDAFDGFVGAGAVGEEAPGVFGAGELDGAVAGEELAHGDDALLVDLAREPDDAADLVGFEGGEAEAWAISR